MTAFTKITSQAKYPSHVIRKAAIHMLLNALHGRNEDVQKILRDATKRV